jgi:hypothetical protein
MRKIEEIEEQIERLSREEFAELREWFLEQDWKAWDAQIEADANAGKLDAFVDEAQAEVRKSKTASCGYGLERMVNTTSSSDRRRVNRS